MMESVTCKECVQAYSSDKVKYSSSNEKHIYRNSIRQNGKWTQTEVHQFKPYTKQGQIQINPGMQAQIKDRSHVHSSNQFDHGK